MNLNELARRVAKMEGKRIQVSIAQIKEIMRVLFSILAKEDEEEVLKILRRYRK